MPDTLIRDPMSSTPIVTLQTADGWLVCLKAGDLIKHYYADEWVDAYDIYSNPPLDYSAVAICACKNGVPIAHLTYADISELRRAA